jgi:hypothetical protein
MFASMESGAPPSALTSSFWRMSPPSGARRGPGWV